jgi:hypothetical protein
VKLKDGGDVEEAFPWPPAVASLIGRSVRARATPSGGAITGFQIWRQSLFTVMTVMITIDSNNYDMIMMIMMMI